MSSYYANKLEFLRDILGVEDIRLDGEVLVVGAQRYPIVDDVIVLLSPDKYPPALNSHLGRMHRKLEAIRNSRTISSLHSAANGRAFPRFSLSTRRNSSSILTSSTWMSCGGNAFAILGAASAVGAISSRMLLRSSCSSTFPTRSSSPDRTCAIAIVRYFSWPMCCNCRFATIVWSS